MIKPIDLFNKINSIKYQILTTEHLFFLQTYSDKLSSEVEIILYNQTEMGDIRRKKIIKAFEITLCAVLDDNIVLDSERLNLNRKIENHVRIGNNLYLPNTIKEQCTIYTGYKPMPLIGHGQKVTWKYIEEKWVQLGTSQTWIS